MKCNPGRDINPGNPVFIPDKRAAETRASCILEELGKHEVNKNPNKFIAQTYDVTSVMFGTSRGVQLLLRSTVQAHNMIIAMHIR